MTHAFEKMKKDYQEVTMTSDNVKKMKQKMNQALSENLQERKRYSVRRRIVIACLALILCILPNVNENVAHAMSNIPVVGGFFELITIRDYHDSHKKSQANVNVSGLQTQNKKTEKTAKQVNQDIDHLVDQYIKEYKEVTKDKGLENLSVSSQVIAKTKHYFTLKLTATRSAADSYEEDHYYTISLDTGKRIKLASLFKKGSDYQTVLKNSVKQQMISANKKDANKIYWITQKDEDFNEDDLINKASFYLNKQGNIVLCYNQGDVAPMYMGALRFTIARDSVKTILK